MAERYEKGLAEAGVAEMRNQSAYLKELGIVITGVEIDLDYYKRFQKISMDKKYLTDLLGESDPEQYHVLLAHNPDYFQEYAAYGADLVLAGHVHGGIIRIPFWNKGVASPSIRLFPKYDGGCFCEGKSLMILSRGLGIHTIPFRLFNPGDLIFIEFRHGENRNEKVLKRNEKMLK